MNIAQVAARHSSALEKQVTLYRDLFSADGISNHPLKALFDQLTADEGLELKPYADTEGYQTIGIGRNLDSRGISELEAKFLLMIDVGIVGRELAKAIPWIDNLTENRQMALMNMAFNLGVPRLMGFKKMLAALQAGDYNAAAREALDSKWAKQVGVRAERIASLLKGNP